MRVITVAAPVAAGLLLLAGCGSDSTTSTTSGGTGSGSGTSSTGSSAASSATCATGTLTASGSTALQPLVQAAITAYQTKCPGATITVAGGGSSTGLANAASGTSDIGDSDVPVSFAKAVDRTAVTDHQVAVVAFGIIVNPKAGVTALTSKQIQDVFSGKVTNWKDAGGSDVPVTLIERKAGSGTRLSFDIDVMGGVTETATPSATEDSTSLVVQKVQAADGGVSYAAAGSAGPLTVVSIDGGSPVVADINAGKYPFFAHEHMYTKAAGSPLAQDFMNFILSSDFEATVTGQKFIPNSKVTVQAKVDRA